MATFCAFFSWCSPERFWNLTMDEYAALTDVIRQANKGS